MGDEKDAPAHEHEGGDKGERERAQAQRMLAIDPGVAWNGC